MISMLFSYYSDSLDHRYVWYESPGLYYLIHSIAKSSACYFTLKNGVRLKELTFAILLVLSALRKLTFDRIGP